MQKLYRVTVSSEFYMLIDESKDPRITIHSKAISESRDAVNDDPGPIDRIEEMESLCEVPEDWHDAVPYGDPINYDRTIKDFFC